MLRTSASTRPQGAQRWPRAQRRRRNPTRSASSQRKSTRTASFHRTTQPCRCSSRSRFQSTTPSPTACLRGSPSSEPVCGVRDSHVVVERRALCPFFRRDVRKLLPDLGRPQLALLPLHLPVSSPVHDVAANLLLDRDHQYGHDGLLVCVVMSPDGLE